MSILVKLLPELPFFASNDTFKQMSNEPGGSAGAHGDPKLGGGVVHKRRRRKERDQPAAATANRSKNSNWRVPYCCIDSSIAVVVVACLWHQYRSQQEFDKGKACCII